ncbi:MAG TPA: ESX secretion-associated protein EspG [Mycobacterium sp.]
MPAAPNAVELTVEQAWFIAETVGAGTFPWVLAITTPYTDMRERAAFMACQSDELTRMGVLSPDGVVNKSVANWIQVVCFPDRWLELRYVGSAASGESAAPGEMLRGIAARRGPGGGQAGKTVVALRNAQLVTFTAMEITDPRSLVPVLGAGLSRRRPGRFDEFNLPARVGARADERLRSGAPLMEVLDYLAIPDSARPVVEAVFAGSRSYVEVVAGCDDNGQHTTTEVGMSIVDSTAGRILVTPSRAFDGEWISTFRPGTDFAIAVAIEQLTDLLPSGQWFPGQRLARDFATQPS